MDHIYMKYTLRTFPILVLLQGGVYAGTVFLLSSYTPLSYLMITLCLWLVLIIISGGMHLDGLIDTSDAYFSYQNSDERLKIMQDPRVGAFGVLAIIVFLITRFLILYELIPMLHTASYLFIMLIPFFGKMYMENVPATSSPCSGRWYGGIFPARNKQQFPVCSWDVYRAYRVIHRHLLHRIS